MTRIRIMYDGKVGATAASVHLGDHSLERIISKALGIGEGGYREVNAEVKIFIKVKPSEATVLIEEDEEC